MLTSVLVVLVLVLNTCGATGDSLSDVSVEYYTNVTFKCDNENSTLAEAPDYSAAKKYWLLPDGTLINQTTLHDDGLEIFKDFSLNIKKVDDPNFGAYYCLVVHTDGNVDVVRKGLNIDGANYDDLQAKYRHNAMVGGIAAAALFAFISVTCVVWQYTFERRHPEAKKVYKDPIDGYEQKTYDNDVSLELDHITEVKTASSGATNEFSAAEKL